MRYLEGFMAGSLDFARDDGALFGRIALQVFFANVMLQTSMRKPVGAKQAKARHQFSRVHQKQSDTAGAHPLNGVTRNLPRVIEP
jgi:hypothetical protein